MSRATVRPAAHDSGISNELRRLQNMQALLSAVELAMNHEAELDVSGALAAIVVLVNESLAGLDRLEALP